MGVALFVIIFTASGILCYQMAASWKMHRFFWGVLGFCLGPLAIPLVLIFKPEECVRSLDEKGGRDDHD